MIGMIVTYTECTQLPLILVEFSLRVYLCIIKYNLIQDVMSTGRNYILVTFRSLRAVHVQMEL